MTRQVRLAFTGRAGSGKSHAVAVLRQAGLQVERFAYADDLKIHAFRALDGIIELPYGYASGQRNMIAWIDTNKREPSVRGLLQHLGEAAKVFANDQEFWAERCRNHYRRYLGDSRVDVLAITDLRTLQEAAHARRDGFVIVRVVRIDGVQGDGITPENATHRSEVEQDQIVPDYEITNDGTPAFDAAVLALVERLREVR